MRTLKHVSATVFGEPWLIDPAKMDLICAALEHAMQDGAPWAAKGADPAMKRGKMTCEIVGTTALIPISGVISRTANLFSDISGGTSIDNLDSQFTDALNNDAVKSIVFNIDSPGGSAQGVPEFATKVFNARNTSSKPIIGCAECAASAAYWIGCQCDELYCTEAATVGSIGVVMQLNDSTRRMRNDGVDPVVIRSSELKAAGAGPLTPNQMGSLQDRVMQLFGMFKDSVQRARPGMNIEDASTGDVWIGKRAVAMGLCDGIKTLDEVLASLNR
jgi:signal peptide peptidase SppA